MGTGILKTDRRSFLRDYPLGAAALLLTLQANTGRLAAKPLRPVGSEHEAMISVGRAYLSQAPEEADAQRLRRLLALTDEVSALSLPTPEKERLAMQQCEDFRAGKTVLLQGWVLSRTEVRLYALAALQIEGKATVAHA